MPPPRRGPGEGKSHAFFVEMEKAPAGLYQEPAGIDSIHIGIVSGGSSLAVWVIMLNADLKAIFCNFMR